MALGGSIYKLTFESNAGSIFPATRRELSLQRKILEETRTATQLYGDRVDMLNQQLNKGLIEVSDYNIALAALKAELPENKAKQEALNEALAHGADVLRQLRTPADEYATALDMNEKAAKAMGWSQEQLNAANELARQKLPEVAAAQRELNADMKRGEQITRQNETETERLNRETAELERLFKAGAISAETLAREQNRLKSSTTAARAAEDKLNDELREGKQLTLSLETAEEKRNRELMRSRALLASGAITQGTYNRHLTQMRMQQLQAVPVVGNLTARFAGLHPATMVAVAGLAALAIEMRIVIGAGRMLADAVKEQFKEIDQLGKSAHKLGISAQDLIVFSDISKELSGIEFSTVDKSLTRMTRNVSAAAESGKGKVFEALQAMNLSASELNEMSVTDKYRAIAQGISGIGNEADQARYAVDLFGKQGAEMLNMLRAGSAGFDEGAAQAREFGATLSALDTAAVEKMNNKLGDVGDVVTGIVQDLAVDLAPALTAIGEELIEALKPGSALGDDIRFAFETIPPVIAWAADETNKWVGGFQLLQATSLATASAVVGALAMVDKATAAVDPFRQENDQLQFMAADLARQTKERTDAALKRIAEGASGSIQDRIKEIRDELAKSAAGRNAGEPLIDDEDIDSTKELESEVAKLTESLDEQIATFGMSAAAKAAWKDKSGDTATVEALQKELDRLTEAKRAADEYATAYTQLSEEVANFGKTAEKIQLDKFSGAERDTLAGLQKELAAKKAASEADEKAKDDAKALADEQKKANEKRLADLQQYEAELQKQIATRGMDADAVKLWELAQAGATKQELERIKALQQEAAVTEQLTDAIKSNVDAQRVGERDTLEGLAKARQKALADRFKEVESPQEGIASKASRVDDIRKQLAENLAKQSMPVAPMESPKLPEFNFSSNAQADFERAMAGAFDKFYESGSFTKPSKQEPGQEFSFDRDIGDAFKQFNMPPAPIFNGTLPIGQPIVSQPADKEELKKQTKIQEKIAMNTAKPVVIEVTEVTL